MPLFIASGSYERSAADKYRFMIMQRFGSDLQRLFEANHKSFPHRTVLQLAVRVVSSSNQDGTHGEVSWRVVL